MDRYKRKFKESTEQIPYQIYGHGDLHKFWQYFLDTYNKLYKTKYTLHDTDINFKEKHLIYPVHQIFVGEVKKYFDIEIISKETRNFLYQGELLVEVNYKDSKNIHSNVVWEAKEKSPSGKIEEVSFIFNK
jgi:uncharacterized protein YkuJ